ncbi:MAG TPA: tetratricopeptide repeat protein [Candidatus Acidoferrales bacterium]
MRVQRFVISVFVILVFALTFLPRTNAQTASHPLTGSELLALVASESLDQNVIHAIESRGIAFRPTEQYRALLAAAGANAPVMGALKGARISADAVFPEQAEAPEALGHLAVAGKMIRAKQFEEAGKEIVAALDSRITPEGGFLMGHLQDRMEEWENAATIYSKVIEMSPDFPGAHARLSYDAYRLGDADAAMREAQAGLRLFKDDPEAHKNMGLGMANSGKLDGAISEYREALRLKPDYGAVHFNLSLVYAQRKQTDEQITELRKAIVLSPEQADYHRVFGDALQNSGDLAGAIRELREAKRIDPARLDVRNDLAAALSAQDHEAARKEFEELIAMAPEFELARLNLGSVYLHDGDYQKAEKEYRTAEELDPSDANAFAGDGGALEHQGKFQDAISQYRLAEKLDCNCGIIYVGLGRIFLETKDYPGAIRELRKGVNVDPANWEVHSLLAEALADTADLDGAIGEARESIRVQPANPITLMKLARFLDKKGDMNGALQECKLARGWSVADEDVAYCGEIEKRLGVEVTFIVRSFISTEKEAKKEATNIPEPNAHSTGPVSHPIVALKPGETIESAWQQAHDRGQREFAVRKFEDAEKSLEIAAALSEKMQPFNERNMNTFDLLGATYSMDGKLDAARSTFQRELDLTEKNLGAQSDQNQRPLSELAIVATMQKDFASTETLYLRLVDNSEKNYDPSDTRICIFLFQLAEFYQSQKAYEKAEPYMLRAYAIGKQADGDSGPVIELYAAKLETLYIAWGKFDKAEPYCRKVLALREQNYGRNSRAVADSIQTLADVLDKEGKKDEAASLRKRSEAILGAGIPPKQQ